ncbi:predicted protein [Lichtheimia corymbifera JMRC:FSU:9682]|uniref:Uncharacterized protein n=1 Tax=Lichtheimia corymbifera JMRC:FSU:9682 TaxID=1263082 RepID=A0A068S4E1_9FUNG|nr:predicted protein [Lichtheimia corymbifera JMRC:FSU:9682]
MDPFSMTPPPPLSHSPAVSTPSSEFTVDSFFSPSIPFNSLGAHEPIVATSPRATWPRISNTAPKDDVYRVMQAVAIDVVQVIMTHYAHQGGLANRSLVLGTADQAVKFLTDDPCLQQEYYRDVVYELDKLIMQQPRSWTPIQAPTPETTTVVTNDNEMPPSSAPPSAPPPPPPPPPPSAEASTTRATSSVKAAKKSVCDHCGIPLSRGDAVKRHWRESCTFNPESKKNKKRLQQRVLYVGNQQH